MPKAGVLGFHLARSRWRDALIAVALAVLTFLTFLPATRCGFVNFDDDKLVTENAHITCGLTPAAVGWAFSNLEQGFYFPLTWVSLQIDAQLYGLQPWGYHLTNVLLHTANATLLFTFWRMATGSAWRSAVVAALFALHPLRVESVAWITERKDVLCAFFGMLTLIAYVHYTRRQTRPAFALVFGLFVMSLLCKSMFAALPGVLLVLDFWPLERLKIPSSGQELTESWPTLRRLAGEKILLAVPAIAVIAISTVGLRRTGAFGIDHTSASARIANALVSYGRYGWKTAWFRDLAVWYPLQAPLAALATTAGLGFILITFFVLWQAQTRPWLATGWLWYVGALVPMIGLPLIAWADRFSYFPCIGLLIMAVWSLPDAGPSWRRVYIGVATAILIALAWTTRIQIGYWKNSSTLWRHELQIVPNNELAQDGLANCLVLEGNPSEALPVLREAVRQSPGRARAHLNLAIALHFTGDTSGAIQECRRALEINPREKEVYCNLAADLAVQGRMADVIDCYRQALQVAPEYVEAHLGLGTAFMQTGQVVGALAENRLAVALAPMQARTHAGLAGALRAAGDLNSSVAEFREALRLDPQSADAHDGLGLALLDGGQAAEAVKHLAKAVRIRPLQARFHNDLGVALIQTGDLNSAIEQFDHAVRLDRSFALAKSNLNRALDMRARSGPG